MGRLAILWLAAATVLGTSPALARKSTIPPMEVVAVKVEQMIRSAASADEHRPGTLVRHSGSGATRTLMAAYSARAGTVAKSGGYQLFVVTGENGALRSVRVISFAQNTPYNAGERREPDAIAEFEVVIERDYPRRSWDARENGKAPFDCTAPTRCGGGYSDEFGESAPARVLSDARRMITAARLHEPV